MITMIILSQKKVECDVAMMMLFWLALWLFFSPVVTWRMLLCYTHITFTYAKIRRKKLYSSSNISTCIFQNCLKRTLWNLLALIVTLFHVVRQYSSNFRDNSWGPITNNKISSNSVQQVNKVQKEWRIIVSEKKKEKASFH